MGRLGSSRWVTVQADQPSRLLVGDDGSTM